MCRPQEPMCSIVPGETHPLKNMGSLGFQVKFEILDKNT